MKAAPSELTIPYSYGEAKLESFVLVCNINDMSVPGSRPARTDATQVLESAEERDLIGSFQLS